MAWRFLLSALWCACLVPLIVHCMRVADSIVPPRPRNGAFIITAALFALLMGLPVALRALEARTILRQRVTIAEGAITAGKQRIPWSELKYWFAHRSLHGDRYLTLVTTQGPLVLLDAFDGDIHSALSHQAPVMSLDRLVAQDARTRVETRDQGDRWFWPGLVALMPFGYAGVFKWSVQRMATESVPPHLINMVAWFTTVLLIVGAIMLVQWRPVRRRVRTSVGREFIVSQQAGATHVIWLGSVKGLERRLAHNRLSLVVITKNGAVAPLSDLALESVIRERAGLPLREFLYMDEVQALLGPPRWKNAWRVAFAGKASANGVKTYTRDEVEALRLR